MHSNTSRRTFVKGLAAGGLLGGLGLWRTPVWAITSPGEPQVLAGTDFDLLISETPVNITGTPRTAMTINGGIPGPLLRWREGDTVTLRVKNKLNADTSIHWHGILLPANMDGVPGLSFHGIEPDERALDEPAGTYGDDTLRGVLYLMGRASELLGARDDGLRYYQRVYAVDIRFRDVAARIQTLQQPA